MPFKRTLKHHSNKILLDSNTTVVKARNRTESYVVKTFLSLLDYIADQTGSRFIVFMLPYLFPM